MPTIPKFNDKDLQDIIAMRMLLLQVSDEEFYDEGSYPSYKMVRTLYSYIDYLEDYIEWLEEQEL